MSDREETLVLVDDIYSSWDNLKRLLIKNHKSFYEQWKAGGFLVDEDVMSMYPCLSKIYETLDAKFVPENEE